MAFPIKNCMVDRIWLHLNINLKAHKDEDFVSIFIDKISDYDILIVFHLSMGNEKKKNCVFEINPLGVVGKYIYHLFFVKFWGPRGKRKPKYFLD